MNHWIVLLMGAVEINAPGLEETIITLVQWLKLGIETFSAVLISIGVAVAVAKLARQAVTQRIAEFTGIRLTLARYLALALEFQLGADILSTAIAPSWQQIGKLGAIAVIRTGLNYFLSKEMEHEQKLRKAEKQAT